MLSGLEATTDHECPHVCCLVGVVSLTLLLTLLGHCSIVWSTCSFLESLSSPPPLHKQPTTILYGFLNKSPTAFPPQGTLATYVRAGVAENFDAKNVGAPEGGMVDELATRTQQQLHVFIACW